jgi:hypothetical protein
LDDALVLILKPEAKGQTNQGSAYKDWTTWSISCIVMHIDNNYGDWWHTYTKINKRVFWVQLISFQVIPSSWLMLTYSSKSMPRYDYWRHTVRLRFSCPKKMFEMLWKPVLYSAKQMPV